MCLRLPHLCFTLQALPDGILNNLVTMIDYMKEGEFVKANDVYLLTAIGNAPWPIGLTMVGIHERSGRRVSNTARGISNLLARAGSVATL